MKIQKINLQPQRNAGHYQYLTDFGSSIVKHNPAALGIEALYAAFVPLLSDESEALNTVTKSPMTEEVEIGDKNRDFCFRGFSDSVKNKQNHYLPAVREAAKRIMVILNAYGNLAPKPFDEESGLLNTLILDLRTQRADDLLTLEVLEWLNELERLNVAFVALIDARNSEEAMRTELRMKSVRKDIDAAYNAIVERVNALIVVNGEAVYAEFVKEVNARIKRAEDAIAQVRAVRKTPEASQTS